ncbi:MAG: DUF4968 domain-containing protein [Clostridia bacterium]|nr:DUF4968 domain-containing protein [Clostridia bacterium]
MKKFSGTKLNAGVAAIVLIIVVATVAAAFILIPNRDENRTTVKRDPKLSTSELGDIKSINTSDNKVDISLDVGKLEIQVCRDNIIKVDFMPGGQSSPNTPVIGNTKWDNVKAEIDASGDPIVVKTKRMTVKVSRKPCRVSAYDEKGRMLISESESKGVYYGGVNFTHSLGGNFYGLHGYDAWENSSEYIVRNTGGVVKAGEQGYSGGPFIWNSNGYGILIDSDGGRFDIDGKNIKFSECSKKDTEYYIIEGEPEELFEGLSEISGKPPMLPKWSIGFINSEWGIDQKELIRIVDTYRAKGIPLDGYTLDFDWKRWGEDNYGEWSWNTSKFPDGSSGKLKQTMDSKGIKLTGIMKPRLHVDTEQGRYATEKGFWYPDKKPYEDYFSKKTVNDLNFALPDCGIWFWGHAKEAFDTGFVGFWNDEADVGFDNMAHLNMQKSFYEWQRAYTNKRVWSISRNYYIGAQRYAYAMWSGDILSDFSSMAMQRERMLSAVNLGQTQWSMDTGGFFDSRRSPEESSSPELYARWMEFGAFTPVFRVHGAQYKQRQPWVYGEQAEKAAVNAIKLRYKLVPYIYSYQREAYEGGVGLVRPLMFEDPADANLANYIEAWMFGEYMLVSPIVEKGQTSKDIYLPKGEWIDYFSGQVYKGGKTINYSIEAGTWDDVNSKVWQDIPLFIKKGAIIPTQEVLNYTSEKPVTNVDIDVFPSTKQTTFKYYDDDGETYDYEKGVYFTQNMTAQNKQSEGVSFTIGAKEGSFNAALKYYTVRIHNKSGADVMCNGKPLARQSDLDILKGSSNEGWATAKDVYGDVTYVKVAAGSSKNIIIK